ERALRAREQALDDRAVGGQVHGVEVLGNRQDLVDIFPVGLTNPKHTRTVARAVKGLPPRVFRILLVAAVVLGVLVDGFFAIVNFYPVAPHPSRGPRRYVVMQLDDVQAAWFQANVLDDFNAELDENLAVLPVSEEERLQPTADDAARHGKDV